LAGFFIGFMVVVTVMADSQDILKEIEERLVYVMSTKEAAVQQTLADTEDSLAMIGELKALVDMSQTQTLAATMMGIEPMPQMSVLLDRLQERLTHILMTQGYQDLTGQVLKRVMADLSSLSGVSVTPSNAPTSSTQGFGPAVLQKEKGGRVEEQADVDDLLNSLGL
jgi:chemotaxis protein CheZ